MGVEQKIKPGSPEQLPIERKAIAVDLAGTLISGGYERPGATRLLQGLKSKGFKVVLMSGEGRWFEERLFADLPHWRELIDVCLWNEQIHYQKTGIDLSEDKSAWLKQMAEKEQGVSRQIERLLESFDGGKYPPLWGVGVLIDDGANAFNRSIKPKLGVYGFTMINPLQLGDSPDSWVDAVLKEVDEWLAE